MSDNKTSFEQIEEVLEIAPAPVQRVVKLASQNAIIEAKKHNDSPKEVVQEVREVYREAIRRTNDLLEDLAEVARNSERARDFEVAGALIKNMAEIAEKLEVSVSKSQKEEAQQGGQGNQTNVQNNLYFGSTEELMRLIRGERRE